MWTFDKDFKKWISKDDKISKTDFDIYKQELSSFRFYSKCLSGATYLPISNLDNIYDIISKYTPRNWYISTNGSTYINTTIPNKNPVAINKNNSEEYYNKYISEYGLTLKNKFTPDRLINDSINNFITVDVATTESIDILNISEIDGVRLIEGHRVLVKDQTSSIVLPNSTDPNTIFVGNFEIVENFGSTTEYRFSNDDNGIYIFKNNRLVKQNDLDDYKKIIRYSVSVKLGIINFDRQFHLSRLKTGYYPEPGEPFEFIESKNWLLRNRVDYNNLFDLDFHDVIKHGAQEYAFGGITYSIPERTITVGEFGVIINTQSDVSNIINNKYKVNLRSISQTSVYYWIVGDRGTLLRVRKHDFAIERIQIDCKCPNKIVITNIRSIDFINDLNGVAVGDLNTILITSDGGFNWERIRIEAFDSYYFNKVIYNKSNRFFIAGNNGIFIDFRRDLSGWTAYRRRISRFDDSEDDYLLVDNINDLLYLETNDWNLDYTYSTQSTNTYKELIILSTNSSKIIVHDINNSIPFSTEFFYLKFDNNFGDITNISIKSGTNRVLFTATGDDGNSGIFGFNLDNFDTIGKDDPVSNVIVSSTQSVSPELFSGLFTNRLFDYNGQELIIAGNNSIYKRSNYSQPLVFSDLDSNFESRLKSKMLFLDYDIASKLNFFTDDGDYRLPEKVNFNFSNNTISFNPIVIGTQSEVNWFNYWQDRQMVFEYYNNEGLLENKKVLISPTFSYSVVTTSENIQGVSGLTNSILGIENLAPGIDDYRSGRFYGTQSISEPINKDYSLYLYDYLMIYRVDSSYPVSLGDIIRMDSNIVTSNFVVNKILTFGSNKYIYMFTEFNENIITNLSSQNIKITNLNIFNNLNDFIEKFNSHPISIGYSLKNNTNNITISANFNNLTSYYNMSTNIKVGNTDHNMLYLDSFLKFGYTPTYNILDYLTRINSDLFTENKEYLVMPDYRGLPHVGSIDNISDDSIFIQKNKIYFGKDFKFEWQSFFINTFVDIKTYGQTNTENIKLLIIRKYEKEGAYIIELNKDIDKDLPTSIDIISRRTLKKISDDLQDLNNIQRPISEKSYSVNENLTYSFFNRESDLNFKVNTDSYAKILLSDSSTVESITAILYTDDKNELSMNIINIDSEKVIKILNTGNQNGKLLIICSEPHNLSNGDGVVLEFDGGENSSQFLNPQYFGFRTVTVTSDNNFSVDVDFGLNPIVGNDTGVVRFIKKDPFLNYQPVDITDIGVDKRGTKAIELNPDNTELNGSIVSLVNVDFERFRFRLVDGLNIETLAVNYGWIYEAEISDAVIGLIENEITWYKGTWECGRWFGGRWLSGTWLSGDWYGGTWESKLIKDNWINVEVDDKSSNLKSSVWFDGRWFDGSWNNGTWVNGRWYAGEWNNGQWFNGIWNDGIWNSGKFTGGVWVLGTWNSGFFSTENGPSYWLDGNWNSGDFENGMWYNGIFDEKRGESRFGVKSYNSRTSTWHAGDWISGSFHSRLNIDTEGKYIVSNTHKYSIWRTGNWFSGQWYGGIAFNIEFKSGIWHGGILEDIQVIGFNETFGFNNEIILNGIFKFNTGQSIILIDNRNNTIYSTVGSNDDPGLYTILYYIEDTNSKKTKIYVDKEINFEVDDIDTGLKVVSNFINCNWKSGIWNNGVFQNGIFEGGIWYNGIFNGVWM
jgi:hypothetical protein